MASRWKRLSACASLASSSGRNFNATMPAEFQVLGLINDTHATAADFAQDPVMRDGLPQGLGRRGHSGNLTGTAGEGQREDGRKNLVDLVGIEPTTSSMPWKRAPSCATGPLLRDGIPTVQNLAEGTSSILA